MMLRAVDQSGVDCVNLSVASAKTKVCGFSNQYDMVPREPPAYIGLAPIETTSRNVEGDFTMSTKINTAVVAVFLTLVAAPQLASAQSFFTFYPAPQWNQVPFDARASASKVKHHRVYIPRDARGSVAPYGTSEGGPYTPSIPTPRHGYSRDFQDGPRD